MLGAAAVAPEGASAQIAKLEVAGAALPTDTTLVLTVDDDDDDGNGIVDAAQETDIPQDDLMEVAVEPLNATASITISSVGGLRIVRRGTAITQPLVLSPAELPSVLFIQATRPASRGRPASLLLSQGDRTQRLRFHAIALTLLDGQDRPLSAATDGLSVSHHVTNDSSLPRGLDYNRRSRDLQNVRVQVTDALAPGMRLKARLESIDVRSGKVRDAVDLELARPRIGVPFRSRFVRFVGDRVDREARGVGGQVLLVALRDRVRVSYRTGRTLTQVYRVGRPGDEDSETAARVTRVHAVILRSSPGGPPVIGVDDLSALRIMREELAIANAIWLQCSMTFGAPAEASVTIADPPPRSLIAVANDTGLPAAGGGEVRLRVEGTDVRPIPTQRGAPPSRTALDIADGLRESHFDAVVTVNPATVFGAGESADVLVRRKDGSLAQVDAIPGVPLSSDARQTVDLGEVDLGDGLTEFNNMTAQSGTLEERTLIKSLTDDDPSTIDLFIVNRFAQGTRQGEAFIEASSGPIVNAVVLDRNGLRQRQTAWTMAHEIGHVLLNQPLHPDNLGPDRPSLLMDSDNNRGTVNGPKRLTREDCLRVRYESGARAVPALLGRYADP